MPEKNQSTPHRPRIAIAGATGRVGSTLTSLLASDPVDVMALSRRPDAAGLPAGVTVAAIDFDQPKTLEEALRGADRLFIAHGTSPRQVANEIALDRQRRRRRRQPYREALGNGAGDPFEPVGVAHGDRSAFGSSAGASTVLRPSAFADILIRRAGGQVATGSWTGAAGEGRVNFIDTRDIAKAARVALLEDIRPELQRAYHLTGPRTWTMQADRGRTLDAARPSGRLHQSVA